MTENAVMEIERLARRIKYESNPTELKSLILDLLVEVDAIPNSPNAKRALWVRMEEARYF